MYSIIATLYACIAGNTDYAIYTLQKLVGQINLKWVI